MGCCLCFPRTVAMPSNDASEGAAAVAVGRNQPLKPEKPKWSSDQPMTEEQLRSQRDQFWDTAPAFEGHKEIWDALKAAAYALESGDHLLAQAIIDGANIMLPTGSLEDCYDELGSRYQLPVYVLSAPANLQLDSSDVDDVPEKLSPTSKKRKRGSELPMRLQLSTGSVMRLTPRSNDSVLLVRQHVAAVSNIGVGGVRLFFAGKQLTDHTRLKDAGLRKNYTVQAVITDAAARLSTTSLPLDNARVDIAELPPPPFVEETPAAECGGTLPTLAPASAVSTEDIDVSVVPTFCLPKHVEPVQSSMPVVSNTETDVSLAAVPGTEFVGLTSVDLPTSSGSSEDIKRDPSVA